MAGAKRAMLENVVYGLYRPSIFGSGSRTSKKQGKTPGQRMSDQSGADPLGDSAREVAKSIADEIVPLIRRARGKGLDFLAYLLAMALKESRRLSEK